ncbi:MAG: tyrosine-type recombinase/integrase [Gemmatimonadaceae bacterium]
MGVDKYKARGTTFFEVDEWITKSDGTQFRFRKRRIPTRELAEALIAKVRTESFEGRWFDRVKTSTVTVASVWQAYEPISKRDNDTWRTDKGRAAHLLEHMGAKRAVKLNAGDVDAYRNARLGELTRRGTPPTPGTLDRETELLKRILNYAVKCATLPYNPIAKVPLLNKPNVRRRTITEEQFRALDGALQVTSDDTTHSAMVKTVFRAIVTTAYDQGLRKMEVLNIKRQQLHLKDGYIELTEHDTKTEEARRVFLTRRTLHALEQLPRDIRSEFVFIDPKTGGPYRDIRKLWKKYCALAGIPEDTWFHDNRRSYITNSRRLGIDERTIMKQSGHKTRAAFDRYNVVDDSDQREAVRKYEAALLGQELDKVPKTAV